MNFTRSGDWYGISRITGPTHNLLRLKFGQPGIGETPAVEAVAPQVACCSEKLVAERVLDEAIRGASEMNARLGTDYRIVAVRYVRNDSPPHDVYRYLAGKLVERLAEGGEFMNLP